MYPEALSCSDSWTHPFNSLNKDFSSFLKARLLKLYREEVSERNKSRRGWTINVERWNSSMTRQRRRDGEAWKRPGAILHPSCQIAAKESRGRAFSSRGCMWNADHRLKESTIQMASPLCALWTGGGYLPSENYSKHFLSCLEYRQEKSGLEDESWPWLHLLWNCMLTKKRN